MNSYNKDLHRPPFSLFMPTQNAQAPVPIAWLLDSDKFLGTNFSVLTDPELGISEYTNGNFLSRDTMFSDFDLPRQTSLDPNFIVEPVGAKFRRYLQKASEGEAVRHFVTEGLLYTTLKEAVGADPVPAGGWTLDDKNVHVDYAAKLLPRAVGYSAALLDYFFRGKLDVDLVEDPDNPSVFRVTGTNASTEPLVDGTLTLYADDPNGLRSQATALDQTNVTDIAPGQAVSSARFQAPENAERFVAVYQGTLGQEVKSSDPNVPGAVIGKVLGGVRVEEVFSDGTRWKIRTPRGVFVLPLTGAEFEQVRWGDADNTLLAQTPFGPGQPNRFVVYEVQRQPNLVEFKTVTTPDGPTVEVTKKRDVVFPFGMSLSTTLQFNETIQYSQRLGRYDRTAVFKWIPTQPLGPNDGVYQFDHLEFGPLTIETAHAQAVTLDFSQDIVLDLDRDFDFDDGGAQPYGWLLEDVAVDTSGRILGLISVSWSDCPCLDIPSEAVPVFTVNAQGGLELVRPITVSLQFPLRAETLLWAVVDLSGARVVASTAGSAIALSAQQPAGDFSGVWAHVFEKREGGPRPGTDDQGWNQRFLQSPNNLPPITNVTDVSPQGGALAYSMDGWLREELKDELGKFYPLSFQFTTIQGDSSDWVYDCTSATSCSAVRFSGSGPALTAIPPLIVQAARARYTLEGERLVLLATQGLFQLSDGPENVLVWESGTPRAGTRFQSPAGVFNELGSATRTTAIISSFSLPDSLSSALATLDGAPSTIVFPGVDLSDSFTLLDPSLLYNTRDGKFYSSQPPLRRTALPATLVDVPGNPMGDYHAIRLP